MVFVVVLLEIAFTIKYSFAVQIHSRHAKVSVVSMGSSIMRKETGTHAAKKLQEGIRQVSTRPTITSAIQIKLLRGGKKTNKYFSSRYLLFQLKLNSS